MEQPKNNQGGNRMEKFMKGDPAGLAERLRKQALLYPDKNKKGNSQNTTEDQLGAKSTESLFEKKAETLEERAERARKLREGDAAEYKKRLAKLNEQYPDDNIKKKYM